jgi:hypothetical protein
MPLEVEDRLFVLRLASTTRALLCWTPLPDPAVEFKVPTAGNRDRTRAVASATQYLCKKEIYS